MMLCSVRDIGKSYGGTYIFENITFEINEGERIGIVGPNGCGKSTILKLLAGEESLDHGVIHLKRGAAAGLLSQMPIIEKEMEVYDALLGAFAKERQLQIRLTELEGILAREHDELKMQSLLRQYGEIQEQFERAGGYELDSRIMKVASGLGLEPLLRKDFGELSGGEQTKVGLGLLLLQKPDLLLLDEPTNHLDILAVEWLENYLLSYEGTIVIVSHDRFFLDKTAGKMMDLDGGEIHVYTGNYTAFVKEKEKRLLIEFAEFKEQQKKIKKMKEAIKRLREWANQANPPSAALHRRAANMERALERMEKRKKPVLERRKIGLELEMGERSGKDVIQLSAVSKRYGEKGLFHDVSLHLQFGEKAAIVGANGTGKSTLLKLMLGEEMPDEGAIKRGSNLKIGYLSQHLSSDKEGMTILERFRGEVSVTEGEARHILARFLFYGPKVFQKVTLLSGGERMRLRLAELMHQDINFLILDEPTNHLDIDSREVLEDALAEFTGTILAVSHDRYLLNKLFPKTYWLSNGKLAGFAGNYSYARERMEVLMEKKAEEKPEALEKRIEDAECTLRQIARRIAQETDGRKVKRWKAQHEELERLRDELYAKLEFVWENER